MQVNDRRVVIVEDNRTNAQLFVDLLELNGIKTHAITNGGLAFDYIINNIPSLIVMDIHLQDVSGIDIIRLVRKTNTIAKLPIIAVTAFASHQDEQIIMEAGADVYMSKPISIDHFMDAVRECLCLKAI